jgi:hypothetical protein
MPITKFRRCFILKVAEMKVTPLQAQREPALPEVGAS